MQEDENTRTQALTPNEYTVEPVNADTFTTHRISAIKHNYQNHPLMQLDKLEELAHYLYERNQCRFVSPDIELDSEFFHQGEHVGGKTIAEVFADIQKPKSWVALYNVEAHPDYQSFLHEVIDKIRPSIEKEQKGIFNIGGFIFISAPPSVTPFHIDRENNCWLQIRGRKTITVFNHLDREVVADKAVEDFIVNRSLNQVKLKEEFIDRGNEFTTGPGEGVYFPATSPHMTSTSEEWVTSNEGVSISLGVVFYSDYTRRQARIHQCNHVFRKFGIDPSHPGASTAVDSFKQLAGYALAAIRSRFRGYDAPPGSY